MNSEYTCYNCNQSIDWNVWRFSGNNFKVPLCRECQRKVCAGTLQVEDVIKRSDEQYRQKSGDII